MTTVFTVAEQRFLRPLEVAVSGRPGTGRHTMIAALRARLSLQVADEPIGPGEAPGRAPDLWIHVLAGAPRDADLALLDVLPRDRVIVVLGKADTHGDWETAESVAAQAARRCGTAVRPVSQLLACAEVSAARYAVLAELAAAGEIMPSMAAHFAGVVADPELRRARVDLLRGLDQFGIDVALGLLADGSPGAADHETLSRTLWSVSAIDDLIDPIRAHVGVIRARRSARLRGDLELVAARGPDRDRAEELLAGPVPR